MVYPSNNPGTYPPHDAAVPGAPVTDANDRHLSYSSSSDTGGTSSATGGSGVTTDYSDGYSSATSSGYVEQYMPAGYHHHQGHVHQHEGVGQSYVTHQQQQQLHTPQVHPDIYAGAAGIQAPLQPQPQLHQQAAQQHHQPSPTSMAAPIPQALSTSDPTTPNQPGHSNGAAAVGQQQQQNSGPPYQRITRFVGPPPVALACTECRARHLKCDAGVPACSRCVGDRRECSYVKSRRGWKGTRRKKVAANAAAAAAEKERDQSGGDGSDTNGKASSAPPPPSAAGATCSAYSKSASPQTQASSSPIGQKSNDSGAKNPLETLRAHHKHSTLFRSPQEPQAPIPLRANLIQLYYAYFHSAHPLCLPPQYLAGTAAHCLSAVLPAMRFIASFFARGAATEDFREAAEKVLFSPSSPPPKNAWTVQALTLFAIGLHSDNDQERCAEVKDKAIEMALELHMNKREFAESSLDGTGAGEVLAECWRRTWWELYFLDGLLAGFHQKDHFKLWTVPSTVPLPCEESDYSRGVIPEPYSLEQFDERYFKSEQVVFSSFAYRVEAVRILGQVLAIGQRADLEDPMADAADTSLVNWGLHLPDCKKELVGKDRRVDEMLFQAHMVINASTIYLHRPKSSLASSLVPDDTSCTPESKYAMATKPIALHTAKAIHAANTISKLITLPCPLIKHTPFFTCVITLAAIVHLSACSWLLHGDEGFMAKERIRLGVGALKTLEEVWSVAGCVLNQVKGVAREVFALQVPEGEQLTGVITEEEVFRYIEEERTLEIVGGEADYHGLPELDWDGEL